jgi:hypothetical protein
MSRVTRTSLFPLGQSLTCKKGYPPDTPIIPSSCGRDSLAGLAGGRAGGARYQGE